MHCGRLTGRLCHVALVRSLALITCALLAAGCGGNPRPAEVPQNAPQKAPLYASLPEREPLEGTGVAAPVAVAAAAPTDGLRVRVPALGIDLKIVEGNGWEPPLDLAAHYPGMKWPGQGGRSFLYAHARPGMFGPLFQASVGQKVEVVQPGGKVLNYTIRRYYPAWPVNNTSILLPADHEELVLYTCTSWTYNDPKIVAVAEPD